MDININEFNLLVYLERNNKQKISQREMAKELDLSLGTINNIVSSLISFNFIEINNEKKIEVTEKGYEFLKPYKVKRAILLAAGFGTRMLPVTLETPKPLIVVNGKPIIETLLDAIVEVGIEEIYIVRGYMGERFDKLLEKYPNIKFIENKLDNESENIYSAYLAKDLLENSYVLESDLFLYNKNLIRKYEYCSNYIAKYVEKTNDWCFNVKKNVIQYIKLGGINCYHMYGISYYTKEDGKKLGKDLEYVLSLPGGKERMFDLVHLDICRNNYEFHIRECRPEDIIELDTINELRAIDKSYM